MFLWADLMIGDMLSKDGFREIQQALQQSPQELDKRILHTLEQFGTTLPKGKTAELNEMLTWVTCAQRHLTCRASTNRELESEKYLGFPALKLGLV